MARRRIGVGIAAVLTIGPMAGLAGCGPVSGLETQARILSQPSCSDFFFPIYFRNGAAEVPRAAARVVGSAGQRSRGCRVREVKVVGLPSYQASGDAKSGLAGERARRVAETLKAAGFPEPVFQLSPLGDAAPSLPAAAPPPRRVDVYVRFAR